jgi:hypothetical protein
VSLIVIEEYQRAMISGAILLFAFFKMWQSYKRFQQ